MTKIGFIAPTEQVYRQSQAVIEEMGLGGVISLRHGNLEAGLHMARQMEQEGYDVIISRGGTAERIMTSEVRTPVVVIPVSSQELSEAIYEAKRITGLEKPRIALLVYSNMRQEIDLFAKVLGADLKVYEIRGSYDSIAPTLQRAKDDGLDVVVGGMLTTELARNENVSCVLLTSSTSSIRIALTEAQKVVYAMRLEQRRASRFRLLVEHSRDGILYVDEKGVIQVANPAAMRMLDKAETELLPKPLEEVLPGLRTEGPAQGEALEEVLTMGDATLVVNVIPLHPGSESAEAIITLQETNRILQMDARIRKSLVASGLVAPYFFDDIQGRSPALREAKRIAAEYAITSSTVLIAGETGTGKELFAQSIHNASPWAAGPFVPVNCAALPPALLESELFGYEEGAFTGASRKGKPGLIELAHKGTLFLDEVSEMDQYGQVRLLRFLQERQVMRLGGDRYHPVQVRVIAATNRDLASLVQQGIFRQDLYYRLKVLTLRVPSLRQRQGDVPYLVEALCKTWESRLGRRVRITQDALNLLEKHLWPGNVRELSNAVECLAVANRGRTINAAMARQVLDESSTMPEPALQPQTAPPQTASTVQPQPDDEAQSLTEALRRNGGSLQRTAQALGMHRATLYRHLRRLGLKTHRGKLLPLDGA